MRPLICFTILSFCTFSAVLRADVSLSGDDFNEEFQNKTKISGSVVTGILTHGYDENDDIAVRAFVPRQWAGDPACLTALSVNGFYEASNEYLVTDDWQGGIADFEYPTRYQSELSQQVPDGITLKVQRGKCGQDSKETAVALWNSKAVEEVRLHVNSFQAQTVYAFFNKARTPVTCEAVTLAGRSAFDTVCTIPAEQSAGQVSVEVMRIVNGRPAPSEVFTVWLP